MSQKALISPMPSCGDKEKNVQEYGMRKYLDKLLTLPKVPLLVKARLLTPYVPADPSGALHLDGLLSWATLQAYPVSLQWPRGASCTVPLPLALLEVIDGPAGERLPVWASSDLLPDLDVLRDKEYWHKRYPTEHADWGDKRSADTGTGRYKEYRIPLSTVRAQWLQGVCIGHAGKILELLEYVTHVGKKNTQGYGRVVNWEVIPLTDQLDEVEDWIRGARPIPGQGGGVGGFTPPYNYRPWHAPLAVR